jgi:hypothetical protein
MAATHTYIISSVTESGDVLTVTGTVDTIPSTGPVPVTVNLWVSAASAHLASAISFQSYIAPYMLAQAFPTPPTTQPTLVGTFSS